MKLLQINTTVNSGSTGRIAEDIGQVMLDHGHQSVIAYGRGDRPSQSQLIKIGGQADIWLHGAKTLLLDRHGFGSRRATQRLISQIEQVNPDIIGLHNVHGYYLHIEEIFTFLARSRKPMVWTFHDCWPFTGHCTHYENVGCEKWKSGCYDCPKTDKYPQSLGLDASKQNYFDKKRIFNLPDNLTIVAPCKWMEEQISHSFLNRFPVNVIYNGIDTDIFSLGDESNPKEKKIVLGVASSWQISKGLNDFFQVASLLPEDKFEVVLIGLNQLQLAKLPSNIKGILRTESIHELASWYSRASVFVNPTYLDNFPTTNIEALACGTPVVTYRTGGSPEAINEKTGIVVEKGDVQGLVSAILKITRKSKKDISISCRNRAVALFHKKDRYLDYLALYEEKLAARV
jgi:glycosyltransferase involved in cell wall biosynthesis